MIRVVFGNLHGRIKVIEISVSRLIKKGGGKQKNKSTTSGTDNH